VAGDFKRAFRLDRSSAHDARKAVDDELDFHIELCVDELVGEGWAPGEARQEAIRQFGDLKETQTYCANIQSRRGREERRMQSMEEFTQDLKYAFRTLRAAPGYAGLVILTLAFGIAANTTIFSVMNPYFFRPLPFGNADELVHITQVDPVAGWDMDRMSLPIYEDWRSRSRAFEGLGVYTYNVDNVTGPEGAERVNRGSVTANMFDILQAPPLLGRTFLPEDGRPGAAPVVVLDHGLWQRRYLGDPGILGRTITLDGVQHSVIGVMPPDFTFPFGGVKLWVPITESFAEADRTEAYYLMVGRMAEGWDAEQVDAELTAIQAEFRMQNPDTDSEWDGVTVLPLRQALNFVWDILKISFTVLLGAVIFVLMIACVNVASLTLARAGGRTREVAVRAAMGARRGRLIRQLLTESLLLALAGGALGVALAYGVAGIIGPVIPEDLYKIGDVSIDGRVLAFSLVVTLATPLLFGLAPALSATNRTLTEGLKEGSKGSSGLSSSRGRRALVVVQVALAVVLITGAGLMLRSFAGVQTLDLGFDADRVLTVSAQPPEAGYDAEAVRAFANRAVEELSALPGVGSASAALYIPLNHETNIRQFAPPEMAGAPADEWPTAIINWTYPGYFEAMSITVASGQDFQPADNEDAAPVVIVNETLADRYWPGTDPVGRTLLLGDPADPVTTTVVAVVADVRHEGLQGGSARPQVYRPALQSTFRRHFFVLNTDGEPAALVPSVRQTMQRLDPDLPVGIRPMQDVVAENQLQWSIGSIFLGAFGAGALLLATLGIYGLISFSVAQRQKEIGVRIALGASKREIRRVVVGDGLKLTGVGLVLGLLAALGLAELVSAMLFGVSATDPVTLGGVMVLFMAVSALASYVPAARASKTDPIAVLRSN
jgi:predicted permease